jgi:uncharacterized delta-60 repeat protein
MKLKFPQYSIYILLIGLFGFLPTVNGAAGDLDTTFSQDGKITHQFEGTNGDVGYATAIQTDGKIVVAGTTQYGGALSCGIVRYNTNGSLDTTFDGDGKTIVQINNSWFCRAVAIQTDGKIVVAGDSNIKFTVVRLNTDGSLDTSFDSDGIVTTAIVGIQDIAKAVAIQPDGKIVVAGVSYIGMNNSYYVREFALVRYNTDGSLDTTFDSDGKVTTAISDYGNTANAVAIQADGKIVAAGESFDYVSFDFAVVRYNADGSLDTTFDGDGKVTTRFGSGNDIARAVAIQTDGKIVAAGQNDDNNLELAVVRYNTDGSLDTTFDDDGKVATRRQVLFDEPTAVAIQPNGKIVTVNTSYNVTGGWSFTVVRYNTDGTLDTTFDNDGIVSTDVGYYNFGNAVAIQTDGRIVVAGASRSDTTSFDFSAVRYNVDGSLDTTFDTDGKVTTNIGVPSSEARSVAIQSDGKIVAVGSHIVRYNVDGSLDTTFAGIGLATTNFLPNDVAIQIDGKIVMAGTNYYSPNGAFVVVRLNPDGSMDTTFDIDGKVTTEISNLNAITAVAIQTDGKIVAAGFTSTNNSNRAFAVVRYNIDGSLDTTFDSDGIVITTALSPYDRANDVAIQADGKIVVAGSAYNSSIYRNYFAVVRYNTDGSLDTTFDGDGKVITPILNNDSVANAVAIQMDGKIVAAGYSDNDFAVVRYNIDGSLDTGFDEDGKVITTVLNSVEIATAVAIQMDGKIIAAGSSRDGNSNSDFALVRYNTDGSLDNSFTNQSAFLYGTGGKVTLDFLRGSEDYLRDIALDSIGRVVAVGESNGLFAVARVQGDIAPVTNFSVSGRVKSGKNGIGNVVVSLADSSGANRTVRTNSFGYYQFKNVPIGKGVISISSKRYTFDNPTQTINITDNIDDLDFTAIE